MCIRDRLFINPCIDDVAGDATVELEKDIFRSSRKRLTPAGANQIFDMLCRQSDQKENRKVERHRRKNLRKFGNSILYKLHNDNGTNSEGKTCKNYERKHIAQIDQERTAGSIKFGKDAKICHFAAKSTVISADSAKILVDTCFDEKSSTRCFTQSGRPAYNY